MSLSSWFDPISAGLTLLAGLLLPAATGGDPAPKALDDAARERVVERVLEELERGYVYPEVAARMEEDVRARLARGEYAALSQPEAFARALTEHLQGVSKDKHLRVRWSARPLPQRPDREPGPAEMTAMRERRRAEEARRNFGFERVERLSGNIGYLDLRGFLPPEIMGPTADAAFAFLGHTDALIVDLRKNGGGAPEGVAYVSSFLFGEEPVHLNDLYFRPEDRTEEFWTRDVPGPRFEGKDVYVLTSSHTFSGAEEFAYNLKCLKRGTIVGERTGGGANPGGMERIDDHF